MRAMLHRYFGTPEHIRELSFEEYYARRDGCPFQGRQPRPFIDICMDLEQRKKKNYEKLLEIHESGLFQLILESDEDWAKENKEIIAKKLAIWASILDAKRSDIAGARKVYEYAPEIHNEQ
jgi:hypothetical protein